jgi:hypothetical protein
VWKEGLGEGGKEGGAGGWRVGYIDAWGLALVTFGGGAAHVAILLADATEIDIDLQVCGVYVCEEIDIDCVVCMCACVSVCLCLSVCLCYDGAAAQALAAGEEEELYADVSLDMFLLGLIFFEVTPNPETRNTPKPETPRNPQTRDTPKPPNPRHETPHRKPTCWHRCSSVAHSHRTGRS